VTHRSDREVIKHGGGLYAVQNDTNDELEEDVRAHQHKAAEVEDGKEGLQTALVLLQA
jgi:hypothetical protein